MLWSPGPRPGLERSGIDERCPQLEDVGVAPPWRRRGIGTALVERCEREARRRGFVELGFAVGVLNAIARPFYERNGYSELEWPEFTIRYPYLDERGVLREAEETCTNWIKRLA
jgi:GNAT superfamily N-acetyltransferase